MRAIGKLGFVQADTIRAPARAQDLTLRNRVAGYRAGDLERRYPRLALAEAFFVNYVFLPGAHLALMNQHTARAAWTRARWHHEHAVCARSGEERVGKESVSAGRSSGTIG